MMVKKGEVNDKHERVKTSAIRSACPVLGHTVMLFFNFTPSDSSPGTDRSIELP